MRIGAHLTVLSTCAIACGQIASNPPATTAEQVVERMLAADAVRHSDLKHYTSLRTYTTDNKRFNVRATMTVRATYRFPGEKQFEILSQSGPTAVRKRVFKRLLDTELAASHDAERRATQLSPENYAFRLITSERKDGRPTFVLAVEPKSENPLLFTGRVWVDAEDYAVIRIEATPAQSPSFWVTKTSFVHRYAKFGPFWLAVSNESVSEIRIFGRSEVRIEYSDYKINQHADEPASAEAGSTTSK